MAEGEKKGGFVVRREFREGYKDGVHYQYASISTHNITGWKAWLAAPLVGIVLFLVMCVVIVLFSLGVIALGLLWIFGIPAFVLFLIWAIFFRR